MTRLSGSIKCKVLGYVVAEVYGEFIKNVNIEMLTFLMSTRTTGTVATAAVLSAVAAIRWIE